MLGKSVFNGMVVVSLLFASQAIGEMRVSGEVSGRWRSELNPWVAVGNLTIRAQDSLILEPGVILQFAGNYRFDVNGILYAVGSEQDSIFITSEARQPGAWRFIAVNGAGSRGSRFEYCSIAYAYRGLEITDSDPIITKSTVSNTQDAGIRLTRSSSRISNCQFGNIGGTGVAITSQSRPTVENCSISQCSDHGIGAVDLSIPNIRNNFIYGVSDNGIFLSGAGAAVISGNIIDRSGVRGISISESNGVTVSRNVAYSSSGPGIWIYRSQSAQVINNTVHSNGQHGLYFYNSNATITNNIIVLSRQSGIFSDGSQLVLNFNDVWINGTNYSGVAAGNDDISVDPRLVNPGGYDFRPAQGSDVIDAGDPNSPRDPDGTRADIGAFFYNQNRRPVINTWQPDTLSLVDGDSEVVFSVVAEDPDGHGLQYSWSVNNSHEGSSREFRRLFRVDGDYTVKVIVDDGFYKGQVEHSWNFTVRGSYVRESGLPDGFSISDIYPNPFNNSFRCNVTLPIASYVKIELCDLSGRFVESVNYGILQAGENYLSITPAKLTTGNYIISIMLGDVEVRRVVTFLK